MVEILVRDRTERSNAYTERFATIGEATDYMRGLVCSMRYGGDDRFEINFRLHDPDTGHVSGWFDHRPGD